MGDENSMIKKMNKKGALVLRDLLFMIIVFSVVMMLISIFAFSMASEYSNNGMSSEYTSSGVGGLGDLLYGKIGEDISNMSESTVKGVGGNHSESVISSLTSATGIITGAGKIFITIVNIPNYVGISLGLIASALHLPDPLPVIIKNIVNFIIWGIIIFVIISALLKGGKV
jgi:hypothetical protein